MVIYTFCSVNRCLCTSAGNHLHSILREEGWATFVIFVFINFLLFINYKFIKLFIAFF